MTQRQRAYRELDAATKEQNAWAKFTTFELETKLAELRTLVDSVPRRIVRWNISSRKS